MGFLRMLFRNSNRVVRELAIQPDPDPDMERLNDEARAIQKSVWDLEAQATVVLGRDYKARREEDERRGRGC